MDSIYRTRMRRFRQWMVDEKIDASFIMMSSDLQYLTGIRRQPHNPTDDDKHADELYGAFISPEGGPLFVVPRMGASSYVRKQAEDKPWIEDIEVVDDGDRLCPVAEDLLDRFGSPRRLGVSGRAWARTLLLFQRVSDEIQFTDASQKIAAMRAVKDANELCVMREAGEMTDRVFAAVLKRLRLGMTEYDIAREVDHQMIICGATGASFHTGITVTGDDIPRRDTQHRNGDTALQPGAVIAFDFGLIWKGYVSDFGRTVFCGEPDEEFKRYHDVVMRAQAEAIEAMESGQITAAGLNRVARSVIEGDGLGQYFTHRLGHGIGIDVHEPPFLYQLDETTLQSGMCFTVEPSIRIPGRVAVRVEDVVQVTDSGGVPLSNFSRDYLVI